MGCESAIQRILDSVATHPTILLFYLVSWLIMERCALQRLRRERQRKRKSG